MPVSCHFRYLILRSYSQSQFPYHLVPDQPNLHNTNNITAILHRQTKHHYTYISLTPTYAYRSTTQTLPATSVNPHYFNCPHNLSTTVITSPINLYNNNNLFFHITTVHVALHWQLHHFPLTSINLTTQTTQTNLDLHCHQPPKCDFFPSTTHFNRIDTQHTV